MSASSHSFPQREVIIVGAGYGALSAALALHKVGVKALVLERAPAARQTGFGIGAFSNAWRAFEELGVADDVRRDHMAQTRVQYADSHHNIYKALNIQELPPPKDMNFNELRVIKRMAAPTAMSNALPEGTVHYGCEVVGATVTPSGAEVELAGGQKLSTKLVILADGVFSKTAKKYHKGPLKMIGVGGWRAMVEVDCEEEGKPATTFANGPNARTGVFPVNFDATRKKMVWYYFLLAGMNKQEMESYDTIEKHKEGMQRYMKDWKYPHLQQLIEATTADSLLLSHIYERQVTPGESWFDGCLTGVGDCAHASRPDLGQGGAMAVEDGVELGVYIKEAMEEAGKTFGELSPEEIEPALRQYEIARAGRVAHIVGKSARIGNIFLYLGYLPKWMMRYVLAWFLTPYRVLEHTSWVPRGRLCYPDFHKNSKDVKSP